MNLFIYVFVSILILFCFCVSAERTDYIQSAQLAYVGGAVETIHKHATKQTQLAVFGFTACSFSLLNAKLLVT